MYSVTYKRYGKKGDTFKQPWIIDCDSSKGYSRASIELSKRAQRDPMGFIGEMISQGAQRPHMHLLRLSSLGVRVAGTRLRRARCAVKSMKCLVRGTHTVRRLQVPGEMWGRWLGFLLSRQCPRTFFVSWLTSTFGLRVQEALQLTRSRTNRPVQDAKHA